VVLGPFLDLRCPRTDRMIGHCWIATAASSMRC
jgi:hypothetical protein